MGDDQDHVWYVDVNRQTVQLNDGAFIALKAFIKGA